MIQGMITALSHFGQRGFGTRHIKVMLTVDMLIKLANGKTYPRLQLISQALGLAEEDVTETLTDLMAARYIHEMVPTFGPLIMTYKPGSMGGTVMRQIFHRGKRKPGGDIA